MDGDFSQTKLKKTNWYEFDDHFLKVDESRVCDCFIGSAIKFLRDLMKITLNIDLPSNKMYSLFGKIPVIGCDLPLYQYDYLDFVSD